MSAFPEAHAARARRNVQQNNKGKLPMVITGKRADVLVVGGGPAGLAAAIALRRKGASVVVADSARPAIDKACGEGLMPNAIAALAQLGMDVPTEAGVPFHGICFRNTHATATARFAQGHGLGVRRTVLHQWLVEQASNAGVTLLWGTHVRPHAPRELLVGGTRWSFEWTIGADGQRSRVRQSAGLDHGHDTVRYGYRQHFRTAPWNDCVEVHWANEGQAYVTPIGANEVCVALLMDNKRHRFDSLQRIFPGLAARLHGSAPASSERGALSVHRRLPRVTCGKTALIGEASGSVDAITGEGLALCFQQAIALGDAIAAGDLSQYEKRHRSIFRVPARMAWLLLTMGGHPQWQARVLRAFEKDPSLFTHLLGVHIGERGPLAVRPSSLWQFSRNLVIP
jgi:flavin-dependent dehydrogenase